MNKHHFRSGKNMYFDGTYFRSKLECRWAAFLRELGVRYLYEPETFDTAFGRYTPDFWLPDFDVFVEIKPITNWCDFDKYQAFVEAHRKAFMVATGKPRRNDYAIRFYTSDSRHTLEGAKFAESKQQRETLCVIDANARGYRFTAENIVREKGPHEIHSRWITDAFERASQYFDPPPPSQPRKPRAFRRPIT
jgi:hypothetical protein